MSDEDEQQLRILRRKRATERSLITKFSTAISDKTSQDDCVYNLSRLEEALRDLVTLDDKIHNYLSDDEYNEDAIRCEEYVDLAKRAIFKAKRVMGEKLNEIPVLSATPVLSFPVQPPVSHTIKLPAIRLEPFSGDVETWSRFWEQFQSSIDTNPSVSAVDKHVFLRGYLDGEPKNLVEGIPVTAEAYEETKRILVSRYGDKNRIIQAHLDYLEGLKLLLIASPESLNLTYIECNRRIQALRALGENVDDYGRMLAPKILRAFPVDIVRRWIIYSRRQGVPESNITKLMEFLNEEVEGAMTTQKIRGDHDLGMLSSTAAVLQVATKQERRGTRPKKVLPVCVFCESQGHWAQDCRKICDVNERLEKPKSAHRCFLCLNRGHVMKVCSKRNKVACAKCKKPHHVSICSDSQQVTVGKIDVESPQFTYLQTASVHITGPTGLCVRTRCIFDAGSQSTFVSMKLVEQLKLDVIDHKELSVTGFESTQAVPRIRRIVRFSIGEMWTNATVNITGFESENKYSSHPAAPQDVQSLTLQATTWIFIAPRAAWWGGLWERMVGCTKRCLQNLPECSIMDREGLHTVLTSIEAALNCKPLTQDEVAGDVVTPPHFLFGGPLTSLSSGPEIATRAPIIQFRFQQQLEDHFWKRWNVEYLVLFKRFHKIGNHRKKISRIKGRRYCPSSGRYTSTSRLEKGKNLLVAHRKRWSHTNCCPVYARKKPNHLACPAGHPSGDDQGGEDVGY